MKLFADFFRTDHMLFKVDARIKVLTAFIILGMVLSYKGFVFPLVILFFCLCLCLSMRIPAKVLFFRFLEPLFIVLILLAIKTFFWAGSNGFFEGLRIGVRILGAVSIVVAMSFATPITDFFAALSWFKVPREFTEISIFAYRYLFVLLEDANVIYNAQKNRLGYSTLKRGLNSFGVLIGSLMLQVFEHSQNITTAMVQRGYDGNMPKVRYQPFKVFEVIASILFIVAVGTVCIGLNI